MKNVNRHTILGNLVADPELKQIPSGAAMTLRVCTSESWKDGEEWKEKKEYHSVCLYGRFAESVAKKVKKGTAIYVEGPSRTRKWTDAKSVDHYVTEIFADVCEPFANDSSSRSEGAAQPSQQPASQSQSRSPQPPRSSGPRSAAPHRTAPAGGPAPHPGDHGGYEDDSGLPHIAH